MTENDMKKDNHACAFNIRIWPSVLSRERAS